MSKAIVVEQSYILSALGDLEQTAQSVLDGKTGIQPGPTFGISVAHAPFSDTSLRNLIPALGYFESKIDKTTYRSKHVLFIYCSAKGDLSALEPDISESTDLEIPSPLLDRQSTMAMNVLCPSATRVMVISSACASGAIALETAKELLSSGLFDYAVLFGLDVQSRFVVSGFNSLNALSPSGARPFDKNRSGLTLGDGAACAVLSYREPHPGDLVIAGAGSSNDANHRTGPSRTGDGLWLAASRALSDAQMKPEEVGAVKCHGTATPYNDAMEAKAIFRLFDNAIPPCFSLKGAIGHTSGAGSLLETLLAGQFIKMGSAPPTAGYLEHGVDEPVPISTIKQPFRTRSALCLSAGFGGLNAAVVIREYSGD